jgi:predicted PurR-regulated permease PerM
MSCPSLKTACPSSIVGGVLVSLVALTVSLPVCLGTIGFFVGYRLVEDHVLVPRIIGGAVKIPALVTVVAVPAA